MGYFIGLDVGTTGAKSVLIDESGTVLATATNEYTMSNPYPLWSEQNPEDWWSASRNSFSDVIKKSGINKDNVKGIGLTGQMHGLVLLDENYNVLRPCIMWNDQRTMKECEEITNKIGFDKLLKITGNAVLPGFTAPKIIWVKNNEPHIFEKIKHVLLPKDYVRFKLTGELGMDVSDGAGTSMFDVGKRRWSEEILYQLGINTEWMLPVFESSEIAGKVSKFGSSETGINEGTSVVAGAGDQAAGGIGTGSIEEGITSIVLGTSGVVFAATDKFLVEPNGKIHSFCHAVPGKWHVMGVTLSAAGSFKWYKDVLGEYENELSKKQKKDVYDLLTERAAQAEPGSEGLFFIPYLSGERTPYPDPNAKGSFIGLTLRHKKEEITRSVLEGVAYSMKDCLALNEKLGLPLSQVRVSGGGAKSMLWKQILADVLDVELVTLSTTEGAPYGAAILAAVGTKRYSSLEEACSNMIKIESSVSPDSKKAAVYSDFYSIYKNLYSTLKETFNQITDMVNKHIY